MLASYFPRMCVLLSAVKQTQRIRLPDDPLAECVPHGSNPPFLYQLTSQVEAEREGLGSLSHEILFTSRPHCIVCMGFVPSF